MAETDADESDGGIAERVVEVLVDRVLPFPWAAGFLAGCGAFVIGYLGVGAYMLYRGALVGSLTQKGTTAGLIFYNSHTITLVSGTASVVNKNPNPVAQSASTPGIYYAIPIVALVGASVAFTYARRPDKQRAGYALLTGIAMMVGYLLLALLGTFLFVQTQTTDPAQNISAVTLTIHPGRLQTLVYGSLYPLIIGTIGSIPAQAALGNQDDTTAENEKVS